MNFEMREPTGRRTARDTNAGNSDRARRSTYRKPGRCAKPRRDLDPPCFAELARLSGRHKDRWSRHRKPDADAIVTYLLDASLDAVAFDTPRSGELVASAEIDNGSRVREMATPETRHSIVIALPLVAADLGLVIHSICELAAVVDAAAGFVTLEPAYGLAHRVAVGGSRPK